LDSANKPVHFKTSVRCRLLADIVAKVAAEQLARKNGQQSNPDEENFESILRAGA
jgi:hypothetical protein